MEQFNEKDKQMLGLVSLSPEKNPKQAKKTFNRVTFSLNNPIQIEYAIKVLESEFCDDSPGSKIGYLYIIHDKDEDDDGLIRRHLHAIVWGTPRRFQSWAECFSIPNDDDNFIPPHMFCKVMKPRSLARYLIHKDNPEKHQYDKSEVCGSKNGLKFFEKCLLDFNSIDLKSELDDFQKLRNGEMLPNDFLKKYRVNYSSERFSSRMRIYSSVYEVYDKYKEKL